MENSNDNAPEQAGASPAKESLQTYFSYHLNRIYAAKLRVVEMLDELLNHVLFTDLAVAARVTGTLLQGQVARLEEIYVILGISPSADEPNELLELIESGYLLAKQQEDALAFDLFILAFLQNIESLELASFRVLELAARDLGNRYVAELLGECITEAKADYELLMALMAKRFEN